MGDIEGILLSILSPNAKPIFLGIIYRPSNTIKFLKCFEKHMDDVKYDNEIFLLGDFYIFHNGKYLKKKKNLQRGIFITSLVGQCKLSCQRFSHE